MVQARLWQTARVAGHLRHKKHRKRYCPKVADRYVELALRPSLHPRLFSGSGCHVSGTTHWPLLCLPEMEIGGFVLGFWELSKDFLFRSPSGFNFQVKNSICSRRLHRRPPASERTLRLTPLRLLASLLACLCTFMTRSSDEPPHTRTRETQRMRRKWCS